MLRRIAVCAALLFLTAATPPPKVLAPYIKDGHFDPGNYGWLRGRLPGATATERADTAAIADWLRGCETDALSATRAELRAAGAPVPASLTADGYRDPLCAAVVTLEPPTGMTFANLARALPGAQTIADTYLFATTMVEQQAPDDLREQLIQRATVDQLFRGAFLWGQGDAATAPPLTPVERWLVMSRIFVAGVADDHANTAWLKDVVAREGWPSISKVGEIASKKAWLLVQHADADPAFQYRVLKLMAPLDAAHDLPAGNYAYLYDRVMLKLASRQRYATQVTCADGRRKPLPLEDEAAVGTLRRQAGLKPLNEYLADMDRLYGACPAAVIPASSARR